MDKTYCIFGDSVVQAAYVKTNWIDLLRMYLESHYPTDFINVFNLGVGGNTSADILQRFEKEAGARQPTTILFAYGVNDSGYFLTPDKPIVSEDTFVRSTEELIFKAKKLTQDVRFIGLVLGDDSLLKPFPESSKGKSYETKRTIHYNAMLKEIAGKHECIFIELFDALTPEDFLDGLHPNDHGHAKIFEEIKKFF